jgi:RsiW-degrading membrane proteinase PrsW (M82 family)
MFSKSFLHLLFNIISVFFILSWIVAMVKEFIETKKKRSYFTEDRFKYVLVLLYFIGIPFLLFNFTPVLSKINVRFDPTNESIRLIVSLILALITSLIWMDYILKVDIREREKYRNVVITFLLGTGFTFLTFPMYKFARSIGFSLNGNPVNDFIYCVFGIGFIEEVVKLIPVLFILWRTKAINEPYDFILYASVSALGFAFAENTLYLKNRGVEIILARTFYSTVAHMTFSSTIAYGMVLHKYLKPRIYYPIYVSFFFLIAMVSHGFYNFWLLNPLASKHSGFTTLFFLITVHIWFTMKNNLINLSNYYADDIKVDNEHIKFELVRNLLGVVGFLYAFVAITEDLNYANLVLQKAVVVYGYIIIYLVVTLSKFDVIKGYLKPFQVPFKIFIPTLSQKKDPSSDRS